MGLFDHIHSDVQDIFAEYVVGMQGSPANFTLAKQILGLQFEDRLHLACLDSCLVVGNKELVVTRQRLNVFYKRSGQIIEAYTMLKTGEFSAREVSRRLKISINTVCRILKADDSLKCLCGTRLSDHRGWCSYRFRKSEARQSTVRGLTQRRKKTWRQIESMVSELDPVCQKGSNEFIGACVLLTIIFNGSSISNHLCLAVDGATPELVEKFLNNLTEHEAIYIDENNNAQVVFEMDEFSVIEFWLYVLLGLGTLTRSRSNPA